MSDFCPAVHFGASLFGGIPLFILRRVERMIGKKSQKSGPEGPVNASFFPGA
jgi:hypothetical protein